MYYSVYADGTQYREWIKTKFIVYEKKNNNKYAFVDHKNIWSVHGNGFMLKNILSCSTVTIKMKMLYLYATILVTFEQHCNLL